MKTPSEPFGTPANPPDENTGLPWPRSWRGVYIFVVVVFITWVALLSAFMAAFA